MLTTTTIIKTQNYSNPIIIFMHSMIPSLGDTSNFYRITNLTTLNRFSMYLTMN